MTPPSRHPPARRCGLPRASDGQPCERLVLDGPCGAQHRRVMSVGGGPDPAAVAQLRQLADLAAGDEWPPTPAETDDRDDVEFDEALRHPNVHPDDLAQAARSDRVDWRILAAAHPRTPAADRWMLANDAEPDVRLAAVSNPEADQACLLAGASDSDDRVRAAAAAHPALTLPARAWLTVDPHPAIRARMADRPDLTDGERQVLAAL